MSLRRLPFHDTPLNVEVALASRVLRTPSDDPADRFLIATARAYDLAFVTADTRLQWIASVPVLPND